MVIAERCHFSKGDKIDGQWTVEAFLGEGTFGKVFRVRGSDGQPYALKLLKLWEVVGDERPELLRRFQREYDTGRIASPYLVHSLQNGTVKGNPYILMEFCAGGDLRGAVEKAGQGLDLPLLCGQVMMGLRDLHANGKVHRDLKPENVLLRDPVHALLTDFGISGDQNNRMTQRGWSGVPKQRFGTIAYMPPEQINPKRGNATVLPTTDIFSFGVMVYELLTGCLPFGALTSEGDVPTYALNGKQGRWNRQALQGVLSQREQQWMQVVEACLVPDYQQRIQTADQVLGLMPQTRTGRISRSGEIYERRRAEAPAAFNPSLRQGMQLRVMQGEEPGRVYVLNRLFTDGGSVAFVGRATDDVWNHVAICEGDSCYISRRHCTIERQGAADGLGGWQWVVRDGQWRLDCPVSQRQPHAFPCPHCTAVCQQGVRPSGRWHPSMNGTYVNSTEATPAGLVLSAGDILSIGDVKLRVEGEELKN